MLETSRLILRHFTEDDLGDLHPILSDPITMSFWPAPFSTDDTRRWITQNRLRYLEQGFGRLAIILKAGQLLIGDCGLVMSEIDGKPENDLGYIVSHPYWGQGYATEAAEACKQYGFQTLGLRRICANMPISHQASRRVAERLGMRLEKTFVNQRNRNIQTYLYSITRTPEPDAQEPQLAYRSRHPA
jgi:RimJ/RimL family protein N-acetyltransferase